MQRYLNLADVKLGDRIMFDNSILFSKELPKARFVGRVSNILGDDEIEVIFKIKGLTDESDPVDVMIRIPFFIAQ